MKTLAIITGKIIILLGKILHRGSSLPGKVALKIDKNLLSKLTYSRVRIAVTGSSGKGSTSSLIANALKSMHKTVSYNEEGSNLAWGITTSFLRNVSLTGKMKTEYLVIEVDERYAKKVFKYVKPTHIVITNITKDQPPRQHHVDNVYKDLLASINKNATIITNMDDPYLRKFEKDTDNKINYYSLDKNEWSYETQIFENLNIYYCPYCKSLLNYDYYNFETLGKYHCSNCEFKHKESDVVASHLDLDFETIKINNEKVKIGGDMLYHAYNTLAAFTTLKSLGIKEESIINLINKCNRYKEPGFEKNNKIYLPMSCKAENATTYNEAIFKTIENKELKDIIIGWKEISRRYKHYDVSWLYDIEFELLNKNLNKIYACGIDKENIKKRLLLAGIPEDKIITSSSLEEIKEQVINSEAKYIYGILNFDYMLPFKTIFEELKHEN